MEDSWKVSLLISKDRSDCITDISCQENIQDLATARGSEKSKIKMLTRMKRRIMIKICKDEKKKIVARHWCRRNGNKEFNLLRNVRM